MTTSEEMYLFIGFFAGVISLPLTTWIWCKFFSDKLRAYRTRKRKREMSEKYKPGTGKIKTFESSTNFADFYCVPISLVLDNFSIPYKFARVSTERLSKIGEENRFKYTIEYWD